MQEKTARIPEYAQMSPSARKIRDFYAMKPDAPLYHKEFGFYVLDRWIAEGHLKPRAAVSDYNAYLREVFGYDTPAVHDIGGLGWCEAALMPAFEETVLEDRGEHELVRDFAGRSVLCFKGRRQGFMPEYVDHPVKDMRTWEENIKWRLDPHTPGRLAATDAAVARAQAGAALGGVVVQRGIGGYMYLRSLIGPEDLLYMFYDDPELIHDCMRTWLALADHVIAHHQKAISFDELYLAEDICYNHGCLISPEMMREFLLPYYQQLYTNMKRRNLDQTREIHLQIDTDGNLESVIEPYRSIGCDYMSPFEVASGCDVVALGRANPELLIQGGIDKRILAEGKDAIDRRLDAIIPAMRRRGGYIPTCDHGVPEEVPFEHYMHFRRRMRELGG